MKILENMLKVVYQEKKINEGWTPFHAACLYDNIDIVKLLMSTPGFNSLNEKHEDGSTPIQEACSENNVDIVKELLKQENIIVPEEMYFYSSTIKNLLKIHQ